MIDECRLDQRLELGGLIEEVHCISDGAVHMITVSIVVLANQRSVGFKKCLHAQAICFDENVRHR